MITKALIVKKIKAMKPILLQNFKIEKIALFGSYASGKSHAESDIDLLIEFEENNSLNYFEFENLRELFKNELNFDKIDIVDKKYLNPIIGFHASKHMTYV